MKETKSKMGAVEGRGQRIGRGFLILSILLTIATPVYADGDEIIENPRVGDEQDAAKENSVIWMIPGGITYYIDDEDGEIILDWEDVVLSSTDAPVEGVILVTGSTTFVETDCGAGGGLDSCTDTYDTNDNDSGLVNSFYPPDLSLAELGFLDDVGAAGFQNDCDQAECDCEKEEESVENGGTFSPSNDPNVVVIKAGQGQFFFTKNAGCDPETMAYCVTWNGNGSITVIRIGEGPDRKDISNIQFWHTDYDPDNDPIPDDELCPDVWIHPGVITVSADQISPNVSLVVGQDPRDTGATLEWNLSIDPTLVIYEKWEKIGTQLVACVEQDPDNDDGEVDPICEIDNCGCPSGWAPIVEEVWGCAEKSRTYPEGIGDLAAGASLRLDSRAWIQGELASAYPGAGLINPDWAFDAPEDCIWAGDVCTLLFTINIPTTDPGWYDIKIQGSTAGTLASPPRSFEAVAGEFGVFFLDSSSIIN